MLSLKHSCVKNETNEPYIVNISGGKDNSPEGMQVQVPASPPNFIPDHEHLQKGLTHGFVVEFASVADRNFYVTMDPAHLKAGAVLFENSEDITVFDYEVGVL